MSGEPIRDARRHRSGSPPRGDDAPTHPRLAAALLMIGVVVLLLGIAVVSSMQ